MPTYDYECDACGHRFELYQSISADPERKCPACKKLKLRRLIGTGAAVVFKGSGFYQTDYRSDSYKKSAAADSGSSSSGSSSTEKPSSEKTPSEKPASKPSEDTAPKKSSKKKD
ncbi:MAG: zinc ribbon domain-containing protein [Planctomycetota bacterium]|jgi:putative FmdB family regulatory protein|nr:zinc ribbon domain-containing protein [Planctomycetota bacterium]